jgi:hypothetical protein
VAEAGAVAGFEIRSEASGPHWIAWLVRPGEDKPHDAIVLVGQTRAEAETRARQWAERQPGRPGA